LYFELYLLRSVFNQNINENIGFFRCFFPLSRPRGSLRIAWPGEGERGTSVQNALRRIPGPVVYTHNMLSVIAVMFSPSASYTHDNRNQYEYTSRRRAQSSSAGAPEPGPVSYKTARSPSDGVAIAISGTAQKLVDTRPDATVSTLV